MNKPSVFIVGAGGMVGAAAASAIALKEIANDIVLIDIAEELVKGQALDLSHATAYTDGVNVRVGDYADIKEDDIVVITSGVPQKPGQSRRELIATNARIMQSVVEGVMKQGKPVFIIVVANPVDTLTHVALKASGLPKSRVFGTGTTLDTARLRVTLAHQLGVSQQHVHALILGEHGDSSFPVLSAANVAGIPLEKFPGFKPEMAKNIHQEIREAAYKIIEAKKATYFGIGHAVAKLVEALIRPTGNIYPICSLAEGEYGLKDVVIGLPTMISPSGVRILDDYPLNDAERKSLHDSAEIVKDITRDASASVQ
ncbi:MAG: ldh [Candidatus Saccharibacteria bacterium]|nr:ldh [Candidatus Saccharibacteria bacterium]